MRGSQFSDAQKAFILKQGDEGATVAEICRKAGISQANCFKWKKKYTGLLPPEMRKLKPREGWGTVVDTFSPYVPVLAPCHSDRGEDVVQTLERLCRKVGY